MPDDLEINSEQYNGSGRLETLVSPSPNQVIFKNQWFLQLIDYVVERYAAKSRNFVRRYMVIRRSFYGAHPFYGCTTLPSNLYYTDVVSFYMLMIMANLQTFRSPVFDTHKTLFSRRRAVIKYSLQAHITPCLFKFSATT